MLAVGAGRQAAARHRRRLAAPSLRLQAQNHIHHGQARAEDEDVVLGPDAVQVPVLSGGRSQFIALKARMPWMDINQERHHAFAGYEGMVTMVAEIEKALFNPMWAQVRTQAPWELEDPLLREQDAAQLASEAAAG